MIDAECRAFYVADMVYTLGVVVLDLNFSCAR
jgi:hypothetical protein